MDFYEHRERQQQRASGVPAEVERLAFAVIGAAIEVHRVLGPGLLESHYQKALSHELTLRGIPHTREEPFDVTYKGVVVGQGRLDFFVGGRLIVELKAVDGLAPAHKSQALTYLHCKELPLALLINFNVPVLRDGIQRVINS